jgi:predicted GNAT family acetyltransferase
VSEVVVRHNAERHRFEAGSSEKAALLNYRLHGNVVEIVHTEVPPEYQGQGLAAKLVTAALEWARAGGHKVMPTCSYVKTFVAKRSEFADLL